MPRKQEQSKDSGRKNIHQTDVRIRHTHSSCDTPPDTEHQSTTNYMLVTLHDVSFHDPDQYQRPTAGEGPIDRRPAQASRAQCVCVSSVRHEGDDDDDDGDANGSANGSS